MIVMAPRHVLITLFDGVQSLDVTGPLEVLAAANQWRTANGDEPFYLLRTASLGGRAVRTSSGLLVTPDADLIGERARDVLLVPGGEGTRSPQPDFVRW